MGKLLESLVVRRLPNLKNIVLSNNRLDGTCAEFLADAIVRRQSDEPVTLDFSGNLAGVDGTAAFAKALRAGGKIATLDLSSNHIGDLGFRILSEMLADPGVSVLRTLAIGGNYAWKDSIGDAAKFLFAAEHDDPSEVHSAPPRVMWKQTIDVLAASLEGNSTLKELRLNDIDMRGCLRSIARCLQRCALESLDLQRCDLQPGDLGPLASVLEKNKNEPIPKLQRLDLRGNLFGQSDVGRLATIFRSNTNIREILLLKDSSGHTCEDVAKLLDEQALMSTHWRIVAWTAREACQGGRMGQAWFRGVVDALVDEGVGAAIQMSRAAAG